MIIPVTKRIQKIIRILFCQHWFVIIFIKVPDILDENGYEKYQEEKQDPNHSPAAQLFFVIHDLKFYS